MAKLRDRSTYLGSADAPAIVGVPAYGRTNLDVWEEKVGLSDEREETSPMKWGTILEPLIIAEYEAQTGLTVNRTRRQRFLKGYPYIGATIDGDAGDRLVEAKFTPWGDFGEPGDGEAGLPPYVRVQVKHQMLVTGRTRVDVPVLVKGYDLRIFEVEADPAYLADLLEEEVEFWNDHVLTRIPPEVDEEDAETFGRFLSRRHPRPADEVEMVADDEMVAVLADLRLAKLAVKQAAARELFLKNAVKRVMVEPGAAVLTGPGVRVTWKQYPTKTIDWRLVASGYRHIIDTLIRDRVDGQGIPLTADLDPNPIQSLYTREGTMEQFRPRYDADPEPQEGSH